MAGHALARLLERGRDVPRADSLEAGRRGVEIRQVRQVAVGEILLELGGLGLHGAPGEGPRERAAAIHAHG